ncbi:hypothetical protein EPUS_07756 [Endocarpon pusillum Z07020]|uniref:Uncharacterized protein n=1 Tax=Endocarpon pusillum (strain Z07020 / HMAS-L-300199) TaxID=1263415 RepID=U1HPU6_ENDPU|nr:uncharacterized protein EPUS_07756 [Endocarpon pusillum Z07020]ERF71084.1 hypothetical protein EPUS_07756 [Endocarpon pusillum Z07020]
MALPPQFAGQLLPASTQSQVPHTLEIYLDYTCPYSRKLFQTLHPAITSLVTQKYPSTLRVIFRQQIQPWHPSSTLCHEAALAVLRLAPTEFWHYSAALFERQTEFFGGLRRRGLGWMARR